MNKNADRLLSLYREYEQLARDAGSEPKKLEAAADDLTSNRLRMCRVTRNYLSHQDDDAFLCVGEPMLRFMQAQIDKLRGGRDTVAKHSLTVAAGTVREDASPKAALEKMIKKRLHRIVVVRKKGGYRSADIVDVARAATKGKPEAMAKVASTAVEAFAAPLDDDVRAAGPATVVTVDGTPTGKLAGVRYR